MDLGLGGKTAVITGASGGIGRGLVHDFVAEGVNVVLASRDEAQCKEGAASAPGPGSTLVVATDVTDRASVEALAERANAECGAVEVLVNNAGGVAYPRPFLEKPQEELEWELDLNIRGVVNPGEANRKMIPCFIIKKKKTHIGPNSPQNFVREGAHAFGTISYIRYFIIY